MDKSLTPYLIAETAYNHEGDPDYLLGMIDDIASLKLNAVKFHLLLNPESYIARSHNLSSSYKKWMFSAKEWVKIINYVKVKRLDVVALCDDVESIRFIRKKYPDIFGLELHAVSLNDLFMLREAVSFANTVILGIGGSTIDEIGYAVDFLRANKKSDILLMYGFQSYPTNSTEINLSKMIKIREIFNLPVGYADHTAYNDPNNEVISCMAAMMGVPILEKHYTPYPGKERIDFQSAVGRKAMVKIKELMALALSVYGSGEIKMSEAELAYGVIGPMKKAIVAKRNIKTGDRFTLKDLWFKRTVEVSPLKQNQLLSLIGLKATRDIKKDAIINFNNVSYEYKRIELTDHKNMFVKGKE